MKYSRLSDAANLSLYPSICFRALVIHCHSPEVTEKGQTVLITITKKKIYQAYGDNSPEFLRDLGEVSLPEFETLEVDLF